MRKELDKFVSIKEKFVDEFSLEDFEYIDEVIIRRISDDKDQVF